MEDHGIKYSGSSCGSSFPQMGLGVESRLSGPTLRTAAVMMGSLTLLDPAGLLERVRLGAELPWETAGFLYLYLIRMMSLSS